jgi:peptidoglycan/xylan/chitin deacetylase (PgdA/CDA1 family)
MLFSPVWRGYPAAMRKLIRIFLALAATVTLPTAAAADASSRSAVVVMYHRFGENQFPSTNIRLDQFEAHIEHLESSGARVLPLGQIVDRLEAGQDLPGGAVAITVDDAYRSVLTEAWPRLKAAGLPMTLFVSTDAADGAVTGRSAYLSWEEIRYLRDEGVEIGHHGAAHAHMTELSAEEVVRDLDRASERFRAELGAVPALFAYPYGEAGLSVRAATHAYGFRAAFGQHSGPVHAGSDFHFLPRFALNERYGEIDRFRLAISTLPIRVTDMTPEEMLLTAETNPPRFGFTLADDPGNTGLLNCFVSHLGKVDVMQLGDRRFELRFDEPFPPGRGRINCTLPARGGGWHWLGTQFTIPR